MPILQKLSAWKEQAETRLWPVPLVALVLALAAGIALPELDARVDDDLPGWLSLYLFGGGANAARTVLGAIATSLISVTSLTFSLTVVTLQLASSQYSPRLLRTFVRDRFVQRTLALFLSGFVYAITVLRTVRSPEEQGAEFVPQLAVTVAFALTVASALALVLFLAHLAREIRAESILRSVHSEAETTAGRILDQREGPLPRIPAPPEHALPLVAPASGFLVALNHERLVAHAVEHDLVVAVLRQIGSPLLRGEEVGLAWRRGGGALGQDDRRSVERCWASALRTGFERTGEQDVGFGLRQLTDVALRALSPGINDPTTAVHALHHSTALLCDLAGQRLGTRIHTDDDGRVRLTVAGASLTDLVHVAVDQPMHYGKDDAVVMGAVRRLVGAVGERAREPEDQEAIARLGRRVDAALPGDD